MFCEVVERQNKWLDPRGIFQFGNLLARKEVELESVYVVPRLVRHVAIQKSKKKEKEEEKVLEIHKNSKDLEREELEEHIFETQIELAVKDAISRVENRHMVILGEPGIGKTCLLRYIALKVSASAKASGIKSPFPVLVPLREYTKFGQDEMLREFIFHHIRNRICALPEEDLERLLEKNLFFFLLDGLDEVISEPERMQVSRQIEQFMAQYPYTKIILTSRPAGYASVRLIGAIPYFTLAEFNDDEIREFLVKWFTLLENTKEGRENEAEEKANELTDIILRKERILYLARNPLLLTILALIHRAGKKLPERRAEFYEYAVKTVTGTWETWKSLHTERKIPCQNVVTAILEKVGFRLHTEKRENAVEIEELKIWLKEALEEEQGYSSTEEINDYIWMLRERAGLFVERGMGSYRFVHLTFQEYFAARYIACGRGIDLAQDLIRKKLYSSHWREVFLLAAAAARPKQADFILDSILQAENDFEDYIHSNLIFAGEALGNQPFVDDSKREDIINRLICLTGSDIIDLLRIETIDVLIKIRKVSRFDDTWASDLLNDQNSEVRRQAVEYFTTIKADDAQTKKKIFNMLSDEALGVRRQAVEYFTRVKADDAEIREKLIGMQSILSPISEQIAKYFETVKTDNAEIEKYFEMLSGKDWDLRVKAVTRFEIVKVDDPKIEQKFFEMLTGEDIHDQGLAWGYFETVKADDAEIKQKFFEMLSDRHSVERNRAVSYFIAVGADDAKVRERFSEMLKNEDDCNIHQDLVEYLTTLRIDDAEIKKFFEMLSDEASYVRKLAAEYLTALGVDDLEIKEKIFEMLSDKAFGVRDQAVEYFTTIRADDPKTKKKIFEVLSDRDWLVRMQAAKYFATVGADDVEIKEKIFRLFKDEVSEVRKQAVEYFTTIKADDPKTKKKIFEVLSDRDWDTRAKAVEFFITIRADDPKTKKKILKMFRDKSDSLSLTELIQDIAIEYLSKYARKECFKKAPTLFRSRDESAKKGAYKLMKALVRTQREEF